MNPKISKVLIARRLCEVMWQVGLNCQQKTTGDQQLLKMGKTCEAVSEGKNILQGFDGFLFNKFNKT